MSHSSTVFMKAMDEPVSLMILFHFVYFILFYFTISFVIVEDALKDITSFYVLTFVYLSFVNIFAF